MWAWDGYWDRRNDHGNRSEADEAGRLCRLRSQGRRRNLAKLLDGFRTHSDPRLLVGYDKSDDASVYYLDEHTALVQTTDFFPPIVDDPFLYGQIAAANAISDVYAMGGEPKLALNILCLPESMTQDMVQELLRGGYDKAYEAGAIITGGHTIHGAEPFMGWRCRGSWTPGASLPTAGPGPGTCCC